MSTKYENYITGDDGAYTGYAWRGQSFTPSTSHYITSVKVKLWKQGSPGIVYCRIHTIVAGAPDTTALATGTYDGDTLGGSPGAFVEITLGSGALLNSGTEYVILIGGGSNVTNILWWRTDTSSPTYTGGSWWGDNTTLPPTAPQVGDDWSNFAYDFMFEEWGVVSAPSVTTQATSSVAPTVVTLQGTLDDDGGGASDCGFEYGSDTNYGTTTPTQSRNTGETFEQTVTGLTPGTTYHFRVIATNSVGTSYGSDQTFTLPYQHYIHKKIFVGARRRAGYISARRR